VTDNYNLDTVIFSFDSTNYTATNIFGNVYNVTFTELAVGTYSYTWIVNDSYENVNNSESGTYQVINNSWWNVNYPQRKKINITTTYADLMNYTVLLNVTYEQTMMSNFSDLRFIDPSANLSEMNYWFNNNSVIDDTEALVWVKLIRNLTHTENMTIHMYYGNQTAEYKSNITNVFLFSDNFDYNKSDDWVEYGGIGHKEYNNGILNYTYNLGVNNAIQSYQSWDIAMMIEIVGMTIWGLDDGADSWWFGFDNKSYIDGNTEFCLMGHQPESPTASKKFYHCYHDSWTGAIERYSNYSCHPAA
jgi:hypothetical protein